MPNPNRDLKQICDQIEGLLADTEFVRQMQWRVARIVNYCVKRVFNTSETNNVSEYAENLGWCLSRLWKQMPEILCDYTLLSSVNIPQAVLYLNSMGIRWRILERTASERQYNLRVAIYIGEWFEDESRRNRENKYNRKIFAHKSKHLLRLTSLNSIPHRLVIKIENSSSYLPLEESQKYPFSLISLPRWDGSPSQRKCLLRKTPFDDNDTDNARLMDIFDWMGDSKENIVQSFQKAGFEKINQDNLLLSIYNLYKLHLGSKKVLEYPTSHLVYLPDPILPNIAPAGFAGMLFIPSDSPPEPDDYGRFLCLWQSLISRLFSEMLKAAETSAIQVALKKGIQSTDTWQMMFTNAEIETSPPPLLKDFRVECSRDTDELDSWDSIKLDPPPKQFPKLENLIHQIVQDRFISKVCPEGETFDNLKDVVDKNIAPTDGLQKILCTPTFGYHALASEAYNTMVPLWLNLFILPPPKKNDTWEWKSIRQQKKDIEKSILGLTEYLLFFEPTLHYIKSYRDHFLHSFNVLLLGYWLLHQTIKDRPNSFMILPDVQDSERSKLIKLWTVTATIHDIAYPLEKLDKGASSLMRLFTKGGISRYGLDITSEWWKNITDIHNYRFIHDVLRRVNGESNDIDNPSSPLFEWSISEKSGPVSSTEIAAKLVEMLMRKGQHGPWAALILHNHLHEWSKTNAGVVARKKRYDLTEKDEQDICLALAVHHIHESMNQTPEWRLCLKNHPLSYLLILCDTLAQWGRTRIQDKSRYYRQEDIGPSELRKHAQLVRLENIGDSIEIDIHYPFALHSINNNKKSVKIYEKYYDIPFMLLDSHSGRDSIIKVYLHGYKYSGKNRVLALREKNVSCILK